MCPYFLLMFIIVFVLVYNLTVLHSDACRVPAPFANVCCFLLVFHLAVLHLDVSCHGARYFC